MRIVILTALATVSLLGACRQSESSTKNSTGATPAATSSVAATAAAGPVTPEQAQRIFHERHEGMEQIGKSSKAIRGELANGLPDRDPVRSAAATIADLAGKSSGWFPAGTGQDVIHKTRALPAIWQKPQDFAAKDRAFQQAAQAMKSAVDNGDPNAIKARFADLGKTCKACHDNYRAEEHPK
jgi:cytochrome c556